MNFLPWFKKNFAKRDFFVLGIVAVILIVCLFVVHEKIEGFLFQSGDTAVAEQALWNTIHGNWFRQSFLHPYYNNFREHLNFIQLVYLPFYALFPNLMTLYGVIALFYFWAIIVLFRFAKEKLGFWLGTCMALFFLFQPIVMWQLLGPMHVVAIAAPIFLASLIFYEKQKYGWWLTTLFITALATEFTAPTVFMVGILAFIERRSLKWVWPPIISGAAMYLAAAWYIKIGFSEQGRIWDSFRKINELKGRIGTIGEFLLPALYVPPFFSKFIILLIPTFILALFVVDESRLSSGSHLFSLAPAIIVMALIDILSRAGKRLKLIVITASFIGLFISAPIWTEKTEYGRAYKRSPQIREAIALIDGKASVTASRNLSYHLDRRYDFFLIDNQQFTDYVVLDTTKWDEGDKRFADYVAAVKTSPEYEKIFDKNDIVVYGKIKNPDR